MVSTPPLLSTWAPASGKSFGCVFEYLMFALLSLLANHCAVDASARACFTFVPGNTPLFSSASVLAAHRSLSSFSMNSLHF